MKFHPVFVLAFLFLQTVALAGAEFDTIVVSEQTDAGSKLARPTPEHPVYCVACDAGYIEAGDAIGGLKPPSAVAVGQALQKGLERAGYAIATAQNVPTQLIVYGYGSLRRDSHELWPRVPEQLPPNAKARLDLIATKKVVQRVEEYVTVKRLNNKPISVKDAFEFAKDPRYFLVVSAYDYPEDKAQAPALLWRTKLSVYENSGSLKEVVPALAAGSGPYLSQNLPERLFESIPRLPSTVPGGNPIPKSEKTPLQIGTAEKIDALMLQKLLKQERAGNSGRP